MGDEITATISMSPKRAREIVDAIRKGNRVQVEINPDLNPDVAEKEADRIERQLERVT
jgi:hypothetical protein